MILPRQRLLDQSRSFRQTLYGKILDIFILKKRIEGLENLTQNGFLTASEMTVISAEDFRHLRSYRDIRNDMGETLIKIRCRLEDINAGLRNIIEADEIISLGKNIINTLYLFNSPSPQLIMETYLFSIIPDEVIIGSSYPEVYRLLENYLGVSYD